MSKKLRMILLSVVLVVLIAALAVLLLRKPEQKMAWSFRLRAM